MTFSLNSAPRSLVKYNDQSVSAITEVGSGVVTDDMVLIKELTASSDSTLEFVDGTSDVVLDSTYPIYLFKYINIHTQTDDVEFQVGFRDGGSAYDATKTTTVFRAYHKEDDSATALASDSNFDLAQSTAFHNLAEEQSSDNEDCCSGELYLFNPSSTTFVKHFMSTTNMVNLEPVTMVLYTGGYCNVTAAIDAVQFKFDSGNIDAGTFKLYGIKDS